MENRAFLNQITRIESSGNRSFINLEPLPPEHPDRDMALATPFAIQISDDDSILVASAAGSNKLFTVDAASGTVIGRLDVDAGPRGIALESAANGLPSRAWVLNALANTVSAIDLTDPAIPILSATIPLDDPTHAVVKRGRIAFNDALASTTGTFSCASCHPDGHTDQLLWVLDTPLPTGGTQIPPRITMPIRGLRDTAPYHWDGIPGDPYGGNNTANIFGFSVPNSDIDAPESSTRHLIDGGLASTMKTVSETSVNDEGKPGALSAAQRDDMAKFLLAVPYPPAQRRAFDDILSQTAIDGFKAFHISGVPDVGGNNVCGNCHRMPFWVSTNTPGTGMEAPTWRGAYDRWLILPQGRQNMVDQFTPTQLAGAISERTMWVGAAGGRRPNPRLPLWNMVTEGSTGFSGAFARQVTLESNSANDPLTDDLLDALEISAADAGIKLGVEGIFTPGDTVSLRFNGRSYVTSGDLQSYSRAELIALATDGSFTGTFTARLGTAVDVDHPQPAIWTRGPIEVQRGRQFFPTMTNLLPVMTLSGRHIRAGARLFVDGKRVAGTVKTRSSTFQDDDVIIRLKTPPHAGMHFIQIQNPDGYLSNEFIFFSQFVPTVPLRWIPHVTSTTGGFETTITLTNRGPNQAPLTLQPYDPSGEALTERPISLAGGSFEMTTAQDLFHGEPVSHFSIDGSPTAFVTVGYRAASESSSTAHVNETTDRKKIYYMYPGDWNLAWDGMALVNLASQSNTIRMTHLSETGETLAEVTLAENLAPFAKVLSVFGEALNHQPRSLIRIHCDHEISLVLLRGTHAEAPTRALFETKPLLADASSTRLISHVTSTEGGFESTLYFTNYGNAPAAITLHPFSATGHSLEPQTLTVPPSASFISGVSEVFPTTGVSHFQINGPSNCVSAIGYKAAHGAAATALVNESSVLSGNDTSSFLLYQGQWTSEFDGMALINLGGKASQIEGFQYDAQGRTVSSLVLNANLAPKGNICSYSRMFLKIDPICRSTSLQVSQPRDCSSVGPNPVRTIFTK